MDLFMEVWGGQQVDDEYVSTDEGIMTNGSQANDTFRFSDLLEY